MDSVPADYFETSLAYTPTTHTDEYPAIKPTNPELSQEGKIVLITGASRGLGQRGFAKQFARANPKALVLVATNAAKLAETEQIVRQINENIEILSIAADISKEDDVKNVFSTVQSKFGRHADVLVQNAGVALSTGKSVKDADSKDWWGEFNINVLGSFLVSKHYLQSLPVNHDPVTVILLTSWVAFTDPANGSAYSMTKMALIQLAQAIAGEEKNVTAVALHPGIVPTDMLFDSFKKFARDSPELVGGTAVWLATEQAKFMNGRVMNSNWDVSELVVRKDQIVKEDELKVGFKGKLGKQ